MKKAKRAMVKYIWRTLTKPLGTVFEVRNNVGEEFRRVNRFAYVLHVCREMKALS